MMEDLLKSPEFEECIQKQTSSRKTIEKLLLNLIENPDDKTTEKTLFDDIHSYDVLYEKLSVEKNENVSYPGNSLWMNETIWKDNAANIRNAIRLIREFQNEIKNHKQKSNEENDSWEIEYIYNPKFLQIIRTPVYLPSIFVDPISGEYLLYLIYGKNENYTFNRLQKMEEDNNKFKFVPEDYLVMYQRFFGSNKENRKYSILSQIETSLSIELSDENGNLDSQMRINRKPLCYVLSMFSYASYYPDVIQENSTSKIKVQPLKDLKNPTLDLFKITRTNAMNSEQERLMVFKTLLFQSLSDNDKSQAYYDALLKRCYIGMNLLNFYLQKALPDNYLKNKGESIKERPMNTESNSVDGKNETCDLHKNPITVSNLCKNVLCGILSKENETYLNTTKKYHRHENSIYEINDEQRKHYISCNLQEEIGVFTFDEFALKYKETLCLFSQRNKTDLKKAWNMTLMIWLALSPERFGISESALEDMPAITRGFQTWIKERHICIDNLSYEEVVAMMLVVLEKMSISDKGCKLATNFGFFEKKLSAEGRCNILSWYNDQCVYLRGLMSYEETERFSHIWNSFDVKLK